MPSTSANVQGNDILREEVAGLLAMMTEVRWSRGFIAVLIYGGLVAMDPRPLRVALGAAAVIGFLTVAWRERARFRADEPPADFVVRNASAMALFHALGFLLTGGVFSPFLPITVVFTLIVHLAIGDDRRATGFYALQLAVLATLLGLELTGLVAPVAPRWIHPTLPAGAAVGFAVVTAAMLTGARRLGLALRRFVARVLMLTTAARDALLDAHREQSEALTALSAEIAHEMKNPLASVKGLAGLLARDVVDGKPAERLGVLRTEVDRMQAVLDGFLNFSRPAVPVVATVADVRALCDDIVALHEGLARARGVRLAASGAGEALLDARKTREVLINLALNAIEASPAGSTVSVAVRTDAAQLQVVVDDEGPGPDPALGARIFEPGVTTKPSGSGLGLTLARALARQQGGDLTLTPRRPHGASAVLTLPIAGAA